jgi:hypothetical protein
VEGLCEDTSSGASSDGSDVGSVSPTTPLPPIPWREPEVTMTPSSMWYHHSTKQNVRFLPSLLFWEYAPSKAPDYV